jgi:hypothetical protein
MRFQFERENRGAGTARVTVDRKDTSQKCGHIVDVNGQPRLFRSPGACTVQTTAWGAADAAVRKMHVGRRTGRRSVVSRGPKATSPTDIRNPWVWRPCTPRPRIRPANDTQHQPGSHEVRAPLFTRDSSAPRGAPTAIFTSNHPRSNFGSR